MFLNLLTWRKYNKVSLNSCEAQSQSVRVSEMGEDGEMERPEDFDQIVEITGLDPEQVGLNILFCRKKLEICIFMEEVENDC